MAYEDSVLDREMFRPKKKGVANEGIASLPEDPSEAAALERKNNAAAMLAEARSRQDPANFQTLRDQDKPGAFRPVQAAATQMPQANVQQQLAQMQAMGMRPAGMATGGYVQHFAEGSDQNGVQPTVAPTGADTASGADLQVNSPSSWTDSDIESMADQMYNSASGQYEGSTAKTPIGRGIQSLNPFRRAPDKESIKRDLKQQREISRQAGERGAMVEEEKRRKAIIENPVPSILSEVPAQEYKQAKQKQDVAVNYPTDTSEQDREFSRGMSLSNMPSATPPTVPEKTGIESLPVDKSEQDREFSRGMSLSNMPSAAPSAAPQAPVSTQQPLPDTNATKDYSTDLEQIKADRAAQRQENINLALIQAGLAMAGGTSPNALSNIAQGGISGLGAYANAEKQNRDEFRQNRADLRAQQAADREKAYRDAALGLQQSEFNWKRDVEFPEAQATRRAGSEATLQARREASLINAQNRYVSTLAGLQQQLSRITADPMYTGNPQLQAEAQSIRQQMAVERRILSAVQKQAGMPTYDESAASEQPDFSGWKITGVTPGAK